MNSCTDRKAVKSVGFDGIYPVIDVGSIAGKYQRVYCSDYFSSIELIPLETNNKALIGIRTLDRIALINDSLIFVLSELRTDNIFFQWNPRNLFVFDRSGKFLNQIGRIGQGPGEFVGIQTAYLNPEKQTVYVDDNRKIFEYDFSGKFIGSFRKPNTPSNKRVTTNYVGDNLFIGSISYSYNEKYRYFLFDQTGEIVKTFPDRYILDFDATINDPYLDNLRPFRIDENVYLKDCGINDTVYLIDNFDLKPAYVFNFGKYKYPSGGMNEEGQIKIEDYLDEASRRYFRIIDIVGTPKYFFYELIIPRSFPALESRLEMSPNGQLDRSYYRVYGIFDIAKNTNILLDMDRHQQQGIINDINGGLSFIPRYYAGNDEIVDIWRADDMKEFLTDDFFATQTIKDEQAHQKLRDLLRKMKEDDNPVIVIAKMK
jgi:hypothetical protein